ncbi:MULTISPECIES: hypothetical protein [unclassified Thioalkalivibrio]|uniref:hypothetical protein n=1 Tax=unclassified Thioalkalivibrio TaxID=2621013 RepID=UPI0003A88C50|nr:MULTISPECIES: hypothetical protein [unclassified Thioalkalivibrio]
MTGLNSCHNHPYDDRYRVQVANNGYSPDGRLQRVEVPVQWVVAQCVHGGHPDQDPRCEGCMWRPPAGATQDQFREHEEKVIAKLQAAENISEASGA